MGATSSIWASLVAPADWYPSRTCSPGRLNNTRSSDAALTCWGADFCPLFSVNARPRLDRAGTKQVAELLAAARVPALSHQSFSFVRRFTNSTSADVAPPESML